MAGAEGLNQVARRVVDELIEFSGSNDVRGYMRFFIAQQLAESRRFLNRMRDEAQTCRNQIAQLNALIAEMEAFEDPEEVNDSLMGLREDRRLETAKLGGLNNLITEAEDEIEMKEGQLEAMND